MKIFKIVLYLLLLNAYHEIDAQKFGYIDTEFITSKIPEYQQVQKNIDSLTNQSIGQVNQMKSDLLKLQNDYKLDEVLLTEKLKQERLQEINTKTTEIIKFENDTFGESGSLFLARQNAVKPILDEIAKAVEKVVKEKRLDFLFDKASDGMMMIYTNPIHDYSDFVLEELGFEPDLNIKNVSKEKNNKK